MSEADSTAIRYLGSNVPEFLTLIMEFDGCSQQQLAEIIGIRGATVSRILNGVNAVGIEAGNKISAAFGLSMPERISIGLVPKGVAEKAGLTELETAVQGGKELEVFLGAFALRAKNGPPLSEPETELVRFLIDRALQTEPQIEHSS